MRVKIVGNWVAGNGSSKESVEFLHVVGFHMVTVQLLKGSPVWHVNSHTGIKQCNGSGSSSSGGLGLPQLPGLGIVQAGFGGQFLWDFPVFCDGFLILLGVGVVRDLGLALS